MATIFNFAFTLNVLEPTGVGC